MELRRLKKVDVNFSSTTGDMWRGKVFLRERPQCPDICNERLVIIYKKNSPLCCHRDPAAQRGSVLLEFAYTVHLVILI